MIIYTKLLFKEDKLVSGLNKKYIFKNIFDNFEGINYFAWQQIL